MQNQVCSLYQDRQGFIWVGTKAGASRFDGRNFCNFSIAQGLDSPLVLGFFEARDQFFCYGLNGLFVLRGQHFERVPGIPEKDIHKVLLSRDSSAAYFMTPQALYRYSGHGFDCMMAVRGLEWTTDIEELSGGQGVLISTSLDLYRIYASGKIQKLAHTGGLQLCPVRNDIYTIVSTESARGAYDPGLYKCNLTGLTPVRRAWNKAMIGYLFPASDECMITFTNFKTWQLIHRSGKIKITDSIRNIMFVCALHDREGNFFFGTENGLWVLNTLAFRNWETANGMVPYVWSIVQRPDSTLWFAGFEGQLARMKNMKLEWLPLSAYRKHSGSRYYMGGMVTKKGVWVNPMDSGFVMLYDGRFRYMVLKKDNFLPGGLCAFDDTARNEVLYGATNGLHVIDADHWSSYRIPLPDENVLCMAYDRQGMVWVCTSKKIYGWSGGKLAPLPGNAAPLSQSGAVSCVCDARGNMWIARRDGVYVFDGKDELKVLPERCFFLTAYNEKYVMAGGIKGLYIFDLQSLYNRRKNFIRIYDRHNGFFGIECGQNGTCVDYDGNVWIPTSESVVQLIPGELRFNSLPPALYLSRLDVASEDLNWESAMDLISASREIIIPAKTRNVRIPFRGISHTCPENVRYKTRMIGYDENWSQSTSATTVTYTNLPPGDYSFEVKACNSDGVWTDETFAYALVVNPFFYETLWFNGLLGLCIAFLLLATFFYFLRRRKKKDFERQQVQHELVSLQIRTINAQLDPHFVFNTLTAIGTDIQENNPEKAYAYFVKVSNLLRSSIGANSMISRTVGEEMEFVENYLQLQKYRFDDRFTYTLNIHDNVQTDMFIPKMSVQIFVENALKHGLEHKNGAGILTVDLSVDDTLLRVRVEDNGVGRARSRQLGSRSNGRGLQVFTQFYEILNKYNVHAAGFTITDLFDEHGNSRGTRVDMWIPEDYHYSV